LAALPSKSAAVVSVLKPASAAWVLSMLTNQRDPVGSPANR
jgi:hypothetical protein